MRLISKDLHHQHPVHLFTHSSSTHTPLVITAPPPKRTSGIICSASLAETSPEATNAARSGLNSVLRSSVSGEQQIICRVQAQHSMVFEQWVHRNIVPRTISLQDEQERPCVPNFCT